MVIYKNTLTICHIVYAIVVLLAASMA